MKCVTPGNKPRQLRSVTRLAILLLILFAMSSSRTATRAQGQAEPEGCVLPRFVADDRPDPDGPPTRVTVGFIVVDIVNIDDRNQTVTVDAFYLLEWVDPRLAGFAGCQFPLDQVWNPDVRLINSGRLLTLLGGDAVITTGGTVSYTQRFYGAISDPHRLDDFPFDRDVIIIHFQSVSYDATDVELVTDERWTGRRQEDFTVADWSIGQPTARVFSWYSQLLDGTYARYEYSIPADRRPGYYVWKVIPLLLMIVIMSWGVFWIDPAQFGPQMGLAATSMLTLIAFNFTLGNLLPRVSYFTIMDQFMLGSSILVFLALVEATMTSVLVGRERKDLARRIDRVCRWSFPVAFVLLLIFVFVG